MYGRVIHYTPGSLSLVDFGCCGKSKPERFSRQIFKSGDNIGYVVEVFSSKIMLEKYDLLKSLRGLKEQGAAKFKWLKANK